jgi:hypothetical protein
MFGKWEREDAGQKLKQARLTQFLILAQRPGLTKLLVNLDNMIQRRHKGDNRPKCFVVT